MNCLFVVFVAICIAEINTESIIEKINSYFNSDDVKSFESKWNKVSLVYENAIANSIKEEYGHKTMNVYINNRFKNKLIASAYYHTDNQVQIVLEDMKLEALPYLYDIDLGVSLASNVMLVDASVSKMIVHTSYILFRNKSHIIFRTKEQDSVKDSPFRFQQVENVGSLAIAIEGCSISGIIVATLNQNTVNLGHGGLKVKDCQYTIEIYKHGSGAPPVIANYFAKGEEGINLDNLLSKPLQDELIPILQGAIFSELNTSAIFSEDLPKIQERQEVIFDETKHFIDEIVRSMNKKSIENNMGTLELEDFIISWDDEFAEYPLHKSITLTDMTLSGLDTIYASHAGGPIRLTDIEIHEQLRFSTLQVTGLMFIQDTSSEEVSSEVIQSEEKETSNEAGSEEPSPEESHSEGENSEQTYSEELKSHSDFAVEISDLAIDVNIDSNKKMNVEVLGWRFLEFSCPELEFSPKESLVVAYLLNHIPKHIKAHLHFVYDGGVDKFSNVSDNVQEKINNDTDDVVQPDVMEPKLEAQIEFDDDDLIDNVGTKLRKKSSGDIKLRNTKHRHRIEDHRLAKVQREYVMRNDKMSQTAEKKSKKMSIEKIRVINNNKKKLTKRPHLKRQNKNALKNRRAKKLTVSTIKSIHVSDNEIQSI